MKKKQKKKEINPFGKITKTINFDVIVLKKLKEKADLDNSSVSNLVNYICKSVVLKDVEFFREMSKRHYLKFQEYQWMKNQAEEQQIVKVDL